MMVKRSYKELRWVLRGFSAVFIAFALLMFFGETFAGESREDPMKANEILQLAVAGLGLIGLGLAWKWELTGGILSSLVFIALGIINPVVFTFPLLYVWPIVAILFIVLALISKKEPSKKEK